MYTVLIVDDEPWVAYGIAKLIDWESLGFTVTGQVHDGLSALEKIKEDNPDVVISDIRMPGLDGLELLDHIVRLGLDTEVIFVSGYSEFEYARKALRLGALDYLVKQIEKPKLIEAMQRCAEKLKEKRQPAKELDMLLNDLFELFEPDNQTTASEFLLNKGYRAEWPNYRFVTGVYSQAAAPVIPVGELALAGIQAVPFRTGLDKVSILINYDASQTSALTEFQIFVTSRLAGFDALGLSSLGMQSAPLGRLYQESDIALCSRFSLGDGKIMEYKPAEPSDTLPKSIRQLELAIKEGKPDPIRHGLDKLLAECAEHPMYMDQFTNLYNQVISLIFKYHAKGSVLHEIEYMNYAQIARHYESPAQLFDSLKAFFGQQSEPDAVVSNEQIRLIIDHIDASYTEDLTLGQLAEQFNISLGYLSSLFKKETGKTYSEYVMDKRLQLAKELLADASLSVQEVVERTGYKDYFHFNKLFKKRFGITPSKYRKM